MPKKCPSGLTQTIGGYCRTIGHYISNGRRMPKKFRLGPDRSLAKRKMAALEAAWAELPGELGQKVWTDEAIEAAIFSVTPPLKTTQSLAIATQPARSAVAVFRPRPVPPAPDHPYTLKEALDEFVEYFDERSDIGQDHRVHTKSRIDSIKHHLAEIVHEGVNLGDLPVSMVDMEWLARIRNKITGRPMTRYVNQTPRPISIDCVKNWLMTLGMAFDWFGRTPRIGWSVPHISWRESFCLTKRQEYALRTPAERDAEGKPKPAYTVDELVKIYKNTTPMGKMYLLMGLFLGWSQEAIRSFRRCHLVQIDGEYFIERRRSKTGRAGSWWVCPELAAMLVRSISRTPANEDDLAFLTEDGFPLVHGNTDAIGLAWNRALSTAPSGVRELPFGRVKKCGAQLVENFGGHELAQLLLAHRTATVAATNYTGADVRVGVGKTPFERLHDVQKTVYRELQPLFFGPKKQSVEPGRGAVSEAA